MSIKILRYFFLVSLVVFICLGCLKNNKISKKIPKTNQRGKNEYYNSSFSHKSGKNLTNIFPLEENVNQRSLVDDIDPSYLADGTKIRYIKKGQFERKNDFVEDNSDIYTDLKTKNKFDKLYSAPPSSNEGELYRIYCDKNRIKNIKENFEDENFVKILENKIYAVLGIDYKKPLKTLNLSNLNSINFERNYIEDLGKGIEKKYYAKFIRIFYQDFNNLDTNNNIIHHLKIINNFLLNDQKIQCKTCDVYKFIMKNEDIERKEFTNSVAPSKFWSNTKYFKYLKLIERAVMTKNLAIISLVISDFKIYIACTLKKILEIRLNQIQKYLNSSNYKLIKEILKEEKKKIEDLKYFKESKKKDSDMSLGLGRIYAHCGRKIYKTKLPSDDIINNDDFKCSICLEPFQKDLRVMVCNGNSNNPNGNKHIVHSHCMNQHILVNLEFKNLEYSSPDFQNRLNQILSDPNFVIKDNIIRCPSCRSTDNWEVDKNPYI